MTDPCIMADIDAKAFAERLAENAALAKEMLHFRAAREMSEAAALILSQAETIAELRKALRDARKPVADMQAMTFGCSGKTGKQINEWFNRTADDAAYIISTALARAAKEGQADG